MTKKNVRIASVVMPVMIMVLSLFTGSSRVGASDQPSTASVAVKIDNFDRSDRPGCINAQRDRFRSPKRGSGF
jgi:hypothetical protein